MAFELPWSGTAWSVFTVLIIGRDFRKLMSVSAPAAFEFKCVEIENHHAAAQETVGRIEFAGGFIQPNLFDALHNHRSGRRVFRPESDDLFLASRLRRGIGLGPATRRRQKAGYRTAPSAPRHVRRSGRRIGVATGTWGTLGSARNLSDYFAGLGIILAYGILADVHKPLAVDGHAMPLWRIEGSDHVSLLVEMDHRRRTHATIRDADLCLQFNIREIVRAIQDPDVVVLVHGQPRDASKFPLVGQRLRPVRIELELRRRQGLRPDRGAENSDSRCDSKR